MKFKLVSNILVLRVSGVKIHRHHVDFTRVKCFLLICTKLRLHGLFVGRTEGKWVILAWPYCPTEGREVGNRAQEQKYELSPGLSPFSHTLCTHFRSLFALCAFTSARRNFQSKQFGMYPLQVSYNVGTDSRTIKTQIIFQSFGYIVYKCCTHICSWQTYK